jgi:selenocysteine-specific elongation factor
VRAERAFVEYCLRRTEALATTEAALSHRAKIPASRLPDILKPLLAEQKAVALPDGLYVHSQVLAEVVERLLAGVREFHAASPESLGLTFDELLERSAIARPVLAALVAYLKERGTLAERGGRLALPGHRATVAASDQENLDRIEGLYRARPFSPPDEAEVAQATGLAPREVARLVRILAEQKRLVAAAPDVHFHAEAVARARELLVAHIEKQGRLDSVDFKYLVDTTRKYALPLLDFFDRIGVTRRVGNTRFLRPPKREG